MFSFTSCRERQPKEETLVLYARASAAYSEGRLGETADILLSIKSFAPALVLRGKALYFMDEGEEAEKVFRRALSVRPSSTEASIYLVRILKDRGLLKEAESLVETILSDDPSDIRAFRLASDLSFLKGPAGESQGIAYLDKAIEAAAEASLAYLDRARYRWVSGNSNGALSDLEAARFLVQANSALFRSISSLEKTIMEAME
ncbi:MAG: tetratricopeptide repeat protein [Treponema sp.]|nr:tetratricopeptide repeat protein [Treponema sp.]